MLDAFRSENGIAGHKDEVQSAEAPSIDRISKPLRHLPHIAVLREKGRVVQLSSCGDNRIGSAGRQHIAMVDDLMAALQEWLCRTNGRALI